MMTAACHRWCDFYHTIMQHSFPISTPEWNQRGNLPPESYIIKQLCLFLECWSREYDHKQVLQFEQFIKLISLKYAQTCISDLKNPKKLSALI